MVWMESMMASAAGGPWPRVAMMSSTLVSEASSPRERAQPEPLGPQAHLRHASSPRSRRPVDR
jgi:hypothetical protein